MDDDDLERLLYMRDKFKKEIKPVIPHESNDENCSVGRTLPFKINKKITVIASMAVIVLFIFIFTFFSLL